MANIIKLKQSSVAGKEPTTAQLGLGELAVNTTDGKLFIKKNVSGVESIVSFSETSAAAITSALGYTPADAATVAGIETLLAAL